MIIQLFAYCFVFLHWALEFVWQALVDHIIDRLVGRTYDCTSTSARTECQTGHAQLYGCGLSRVVGCLRVLLQYVSRRGQQYLIGQDTTY